jgi:hypothetical protein
MQIQQCPMAMVILCLVLVGCGKTEQDQDQDQDQEIIAISPAVSEIPIPSDTMDFSQSKATLTIVRTFPFLIGDLTITAAIPLFFMIDEEDPGKKAIVFGKGKGIAVMDSGASGTGGSYPQTAEWPVEYDVRGGLTPDRVECEIKLTVDEIFLLSKGAVLRGSPLGDFPIPPGEDLLTTFPDLSFMESDPRFTVVDSLATSVFTIDDWCLPEGTWCTFGCSAG